MKEKIKKFLIVKNENVLTFALRKRAEVIKTIKPKRFPDESEVVASYKFFEMLRIAKTHK